ncbi:MAG TPA: nuclear transport factor 2 family protein [Paludibacter sp.]|nr:nuclear transport factor 2 family protein [Paludibacter sp.]
MKKLIYPLIFAALLMSGCKSKTPDMESSMKAINELLDKNEAAIKNRNLDSMAALLDDRGLYCGTDPSELWTKKQICDEYARMFADSTVNFDRTVVSKREIRVQEDGNSAIVIEQWIIEQLFPKMPVRMITQLIKEGNAWKINFTSISLIPLNNDVVKLNKAMEK